MSVCCVPCSCYNRATSRVGEANIYQAQIQFVYNLALATALWATAIRVGLSITPGDLARSVRRGRSLTRALLLNLVVLPVIVWGSTHFLRVDLGVSIGLVLLAAAPGGPYGLTAAHLAGGDTALALLLVSVLQAARIVTIPLWLGVYLSFGPQQFLEVIGVLVLYIFVPLLIGLGLKRFFHRGARRLVVPANRVGNISIVILIASAILLYAEPLRAVIMSQAMLLILSIQALSFGLGYLMGGAQAPEKRTIAVTAIVRSSTAAILIASQLYASLPGTAATVIAYGVSALVTSTLAALGMKHARRIVFWKADSTEME